MRMRGVVLLAVILALFACKKEGAPTELELDLHRTSAAMETHMSGLFNSPVVSKATDSFFDALGDDVSLKAKGVALVALLQADPAVAKPVEKLMGELTQDPTVKKTVMELMASHPTASPDEIGTMVGERFAAQWASPQINEAWSRAWDRLLKRVALDPDLVVVEHAVVVRFEAKYSDATVTAKWAKRMAELAPGASRDKATEIFLSKFFADGRLEGIVADMLGNARFRSESAIALGKLIALPSVSKDAIDGAAAMLADPTVMAAATSLMKQLITTHPDAKIVSDALESLLTSASVVKTLQAVLHTAATDPSVATVGNAWLDALAQDPGLRADFDKFIYGW